MRFADKVFRVEKSWAIEIPVLDIATQGRTKKEAGEMIADAVESLVDKKGFEARVFRAPGCLLSCHAVPNPGRQQNGGARPGDIRGFGWLGARRTAPGSRGGMPAKRPHPCCRGGPFMA